MLVQLVDGPVPKELQSVQLTITIVQPASLHCVISAMTVLMLDVLLAKLERH